MAAVLMPSGMCTASLQVSAELGGWQSFTLQSLWPQCQLGGVGHDFLCGVQVE